MAVPAASRQVGHLIPVTGNCHNFCSALLSSYTKHLSFFFFSLFIYFGRGGWHCTWALSPPEAAEGLSCYHGNPCLAADLLYTEKGREKGGLEEEKNGLEEEKDANKILRAGFRNGTVDAWLLATACSCRVSLL